MAVGHTVCILIWPECCCPTWPSPGGNQQWRAVEQVTRCCTDLQQKNKSERLRPYPMPHNPPWTDPIAMLFRISAPGRYVVCRGNIYIEQLLSVKPTEGYITCVALLPWRRGSRSTAAWPSTAVFSSFCFFSLGRISITVTDPENTTTTRSGGTHKLRFHLWDC